MRAALVSLTVVAPDWLRAHSQQEWVGRYGPRSEDSRAPLEEEARVAFAEEIGQQGRELLDALFDPTAPQWLRLVSAIEILRQVWVQNYQRIENAVRWRSSEDLPPASRYISFPYDDNAHYSKKSISWTPAIDNRKNEVIKIKFSMTDCQICSSRSRCTQSIRHTRRTVTIRPQEQYCALEQRREREKNKEFTQIYAKRAGIEGTISQGVWTMGMRRTRYIGQEKTHLQHIATGAALNIVRCMAWFSGLPRAQTRRSTFTRLYVLRRVRQQ